MSHSQERTEKDCLNCGTIVYGRFCHVCGQENIVPKESFGKMAIHFFYDLTHFDSKFFDTLRYLIFRPGYLPREYINGRRARYLHPIRMYLFTSAFFFLVFFAIYSSDEAVRTNTNTFLTREQRLEEIEDLKKELAKNPSDSLIKKEQLRLLQDTSSPVSFGQIAVLDTSIDFTFIYPVIYRTRAEYDSAQKVQKKKDGWFKRRMTLRGIELRNDIRNEGATVLKKWGNDFLHSLPYLLFVSLPFFAAILKLLYVRRKKFFYADHAIFTVYHYIFSFILLLVAFAFLELRDVTGWKIFNWVAGILFISWPIYLLISMKRFYMQGRALTVIKFLLLNLVGFIMLVILFTLFMLITLL